MKHAFLVISMIFLLVASIWTQEIQVSKLTIIGRNPVNVRVYDKVTKTWSEEEGFRYAALVYLKNISTETVTVSTNCVLQRFIHSSPKPELILDAGNRKPIGGDPFLAPSDGVTSDAPIPPGTLIVGGAPVIQGPPTRENMGLVDLQPSEETAIEVQVQVDMRATIEEISVSYSAKDYYDGRVGFWTGELSSKTFIVEN